MQPAQQGLQALLVPLVAPEPPALSVPPERPAHRLPELPEQPAPPDLPASPELPGQPAQQEPTGQRERLGQREQREVMALPVQLEV